MSLKGQDLTLSHLKQSKIRIADIVFAIEGLTSPWTWRGEEAFEAFRSQDSADLVLRLHHGRRPAQALCGEMVRSVAGVRNIYLSQDTWAFEFYPRDRMLMPHRPPHQLLTFDRRFTAGDLYVWADGISKRPALEFGLFLFELFADMLPFYNGMMLHASGISDGGQGIIFAGPSGAGKSTLAELWQECDGVKLLHDDRIILRKKGEQWWAHPVAGIGEFRAACAEGVLLEAIFLVSHSQQNLAERMGVAKAAGALLPHISLPLYDAVAVRLGLDLLDDLLQKVPVYQLGFLPDDSAIDCIKDTIPWG